MEKIKKALERARVERSPTYVSHVSKNMDVRTRFRITPVKHVRLDPSFLEKTRIINLMNAEDPILDYYRLLRSQILQELEKNAAKIICVTGANPNEGKTTTAINLAISLSVQPENKVVLIDGDLRNGSVASCLDISVKTGLADFLDGEATLDQAALDLNFNDFVVIPAGAPTSNSSELVNSIQMKHLLTNLRRDHQRITVIDLPPILSTEYAASLASESDGVLVVVSEHDTKVKNLKKALSMLNASKAKILGFVLNKSLRDPEVKYYRAS